MNQTIKIAMWSGPRNLSTAMMRSFGARSDTICTDEPFYAAFLQLTGIDHPMREETLAVHESDPQRVARSLLKDGAGIHYQKHMTHHMVDGIPRDWMASVRHAFLIRHPARVLASYARKRERATLDDIGFPLQAELYDWASNRSSAQPVIIDSDDILRAPEPALKALCKALDIRFDPAMLSWAPGPKPEDGAWAPHWYDAVNASTGFGKPPGPIPPVAQDQQPILSAAMPIYERLAEYRLRVPA